MRCRRQLRPLRRSAAWLAAGLWIGLGQMPAAQANGDWYAGCSREGEAAYCYRPFAEGLAAVQLGSLQEYHPTWGYLNLEGELAIAPAFDDAESFQNGLAAAARGDKWGYIDRTGAWVIDAAFERATGFNAAGTAIVEMEDRIELIDRRGQTVKAFPLGTRSRGFRPGQELAMVEQESAPLAWHIASGRLLRAPDSVGALEAGYGRDSWVSPQWLAAQTRQANYRGRWGLLKQDGNWLATPEVLQSRLAPVSDGKLAAISREESHQWQLADLQGKIVKDTLYATLDLLAPGYWLGRNHQGTELLDANLKRLGHWSEDDLRVQRKPEWDFAIVSDGQAIHILNDGQPAISLALAHQAVRVWDERIWVFSESPAGTSRYGLGEPGVLAQVYDRRGQPLLARAQDKTPGAAPAAQDAPGAADAEKADQDQAAAPAPLVRQPATRDLLDGYAVRVLSDDRQRASDAARSFWPLAILNPINDERPLPPAILTAAGEIVSAADWRNIQASDEGGPLLVTLENQHTGALDAQGNWLVEPDYRDLEAFRGGYTRALPDDSRDGWRSAVLIDMQGRPVELPAKVDDGMVRLENGLVAYRAENGHGQERIFLWDIAAGRDINAEGFQELQAFDEGYARAQQKGKWGLLGTQGKWLVPPSQQYAPSVRRLPGGVLQVEEAGSSSQVRLYRPDGSTVGPLLNEEVRHLGHGKFLVSLAENKAAAVLDANTGKVSALPEHPSQNLSVAGADTWLLVRGDYRTGAIDAKGNWRIAPTLSDFNPFFVQPAGLARAVGTGGSYLVDEQGKKVLPALGDARPLNEMDRLVLYDQEGESLLVNRAGQVITRVEGDYSLEAESASEGLLPYSPGRSHKYGFLDAAGKRVIGAYFDKLGPMKDGRAAALRRERAGKAYGYIDRSGRYAILPDFTWVSDFSEGRALVRRERLVQYIDTSGAAIAYFGVLCNHVAVITPDDRVLWPAADKLQCSDLVKDAADSRADPPPPEPVRAQAPAPVPAPPAALAPGA